MSRLLQGGFDFYFQLLLTGFIYCKKKKHFALFLRIIRLKLIQVNLMKQDVAG